MLVVRGLSVSIAAPNVDLDRDYDEVAALEKGERDDILKYASTFCLTC